jgi:hypothetical protein
VHFSLLSLNQTVNDLQIDVTKRPALPERGKYLGIFQKNKQTDDPLPRPKRFKPNIIIQVSNKKMEEKENDVTSAASLIRSENSDNKSRPLGDE